MTSEQILEKVRQVMIDVFDLDDLSISANTTAAEIKEWDSLSHIRLIVAVEKAFRIKFKNSELSDLKNVGALSDVISSKVN